MSVGGERENEVEVRWIGVKQVWSSFKVQQNSWNGVKVTRISIEPTEGVLNVESQNTMLHPLLMDCVHFGK